MVREHFQPTKVLLRSKWRPLQAEAIDFGSSRLSQHHVEPSAIRLSIANPWARSSRARYLGYRTLQQPHTRSVAAIARAAPVCRRRVQPTGFDSRFGRHRGTASSSIHLSGFETTNITLGRVRLPPPQRSSRAANCGMWSPVVTNSASRNGSCGGDILTSTSATLPESRRMVPGPRRCPPSQSGVCGDEGPSGIQ